MSAEAGVHAAGIDELEYRSKTIPRLLGYMIGGPRKGKFAIAVVLRVVALLGLTAIPFIMGSGMNVITEGGDASDLNPWGVAGLVAGGVYLFFSFLSDRMFSRMASQGLYELNIDMFSNLQSLSMGFFFSNPPGELSSNVTNDAEVVSLFYTNAVSQIIRAFLQIFMILIVMTLMNWQLTVVALITVPFLLGAVYVLSLIHI